MNNTSFSFNDIFKSSFLDRVTSFSAVDVALAIGVSFLIGLFIYAVYKKTFQGVLYSKGFHTSLIGMTMTTALVIVGVTSNVVLSLGMVGALSIVRFRTAIKDPLDIVYLFWSIGAGILSGAGMIPLAIFGSLAIGLVMVLFINKTTFDNPYLVVVSCHDTKAENEVTNTLAGAVKKYAVKSKAVTNSEGIELTLEVRLKDMQTSFVNDLGRISGVNSVVLVSYNGDYVA